MLAELWVSVIEEPLWSRWVLLPLKTAATDANDTCKLPMDPLTGRRSILSGTGFNNSGPRFAAQPWPEILRLDKHRPGHRKHGAFRRADVIGLLTARGVGTSMMAE